MFDPFSKSHLAFIAGMLFICQGGVYVHIGKAWTRGAGWVYRDKEPMAFWWHIVFYFLVGIALIAYYVFLTSQLSH